RPGHPSRPPGGGGASAWPPASPARRPRSPRPRRRPWPPRPAPRSAPPYRRPLPSRDRRDGRRGSSHPPRSGVATEHARRSELAELVADHRLADEHGHVLAPVVDRERVPDHLREDRRGARPRPDHLTAVFLVHLVDPRHQALFHPWPLLARTAHDRLRPSTDTQGKPGKDARRVAYFVRERTRTPTRHRHTCPWRSSTHGPCLLERLICSCPF